MDLKTTKILILLSYLAVVVVNALANILPINNISTGELSDLYPNLFVPIGFTFSIWGLIYLLLGAYVLYQLGLFQKKKPKKNLIEKLGKYFIITSIANIGWIFAWHYMFVGLSLLFMFVLLITLIKIADLLNKQKLTKREYFFLLLPFSIYFGWISVATIANVTTFLVDINWSGWGISQSIWTIIILIIGTFIGVVRMLKDKNIIYGLVFVWAYFGIFAKHVSPLGFNNQYPAIILTTILCMLIFLIFGLINLRKKR